MGGHSVLMLPLDSALRFATHFTFDVMPEVQEGMLLYLGQTRDSKHLDFFSLAMR
jgi:hypothetical protein